MYFWEVFLLHTVLRFHEIVINARKETGFELRRIGKMDIFPLTFYIPSNNTLKADALLEGGSKMHIGAIKCGCYKYI